MLRFMSLIMAGIAMCIPLLAFAGPPIVTDDTGTPGPGKWEMNIGFNVEKRQSETVYQAPTLDLNYGVGEHIQLNYSVPWIVLHADGTTKSGAGNSEVAVKWRFLDQDKQGVDMSVYPRFIFNSLSSSADRGIVERESIFRLPVQIEKKIEIVTINPEIGYDFHQKNDNNWIYAVALKYAEIKGVELLGEIFGSMNTRFAKKENGVNIGFRKDVSENFSFHASVGRGLRASSDEPKLLSYIGLQGRF